MNSTAAKASRFTVIFSFLIFIAVIVVVAISSSAYSIQFGSVGVVTRFGQIIGNSQGPGLHFKIPFIDNVLVYRTQKIVYQTLFDNDTRNSGNFAPTTPAEDGTSYDDDFLAPLQSSSTADYQDVAIDTTTKDGQQVKITYSIRFSLDPNKVVQTANTLGTEAEVVEKVVKTDSRVWARNIPRNYSALDLYTGNIDKVSLEIEDVLKPIFEENGIILDEFAIRSISFREEYVQTIENRQIEKERIATEEFKAQQEEFIKQQVITRAQGESEAQRLQQQTLNADLINKLYIEKWNGVLPTTVTGDSGLLLNLR